MTGTEWLTATELQLQTFLNQQSDLRKLRQFSLACLPVVSVYVQDHRLRLAVELLAEVVEGKASPDALRAALTSAHEVVYELVQDASEQRWHHVNVSVALAIASALADEPIRVATVAEHCIEAVWIAADKNVSDAIRQAEHARQSALVRDIFGNPFRPVVFDLRWRSETAVALASAIYAERAFDRLPILADALEEAGCDNADILDHCRGPGQHARGCWVVDLVLGKE